MAGASTLSDSVLTNRGKMETLHKTMKGFLQDFLQDCKTLSAKELALSVAMMQPVAPRVPDDDDVFGNWIWRHERMWTRAIVRALKRHRRWSMVFKILEANIDHIHEGTIVDEDYHVLMMHELRKYR